MHGDERYESCYCLFFSSSHSSCYYWGNKVELLRSFRSRYNDGGPWFMFFRNILSGIFFI